MIRSLLLPLALAAAAEPPSVIDPVPFDHDEHARVFDRTGLACVTCHPVGLTGWEAGALPKAPTSTCHACHAGEVRGAGRGAPTACVLCHAVRAELRPVDHTLDWEVRHGDAARAAGQRCADCHTRGSCLDCHDRRGAGAASPHGPGFARYHGVEARLDPRSCSTCHTEASCAACHTTGGTPW